MMRRLWIILALSISLYSYPYAIGFAQTEPPKAEKNNQTTSSTPSAEATATWLNDFVKERGEISSVTEIFANSGTLPVQSTRIGFDKEGLVYNDSPPYYSTVSWDEVRSIQLIPSGGVDIYCMAHFWTIESPYSADVPTAPRTERNAVPIHLRFQLSQASTSDYGRVVKALKHLVELNGGYAKPNKIF
jgi:hypothetical protein